MKKIFIITVFSLITLQAYAISLTDIKDVCAELVTKELNKPQKEDLRAYKMAEDACICAGQEMPSSITKTKFKQLMESNDESMEEIFKSCLMRTMFSMPEMQLLMLSAF